MAIGSGKPRRKPTGVAEGEGARSGCAGKFTRLVSHLRLRLSSIFMYILSLSPFFVDPLFCNQSPSHEKLCDLDSPERPGNKQRAGECIMEALGTTFFAANIDLQLLM